MNKPKPTDRIKASVARMRLADTNEEFKKYLTDLIAYEKEVLVSASLETVRVHQGRALAFQEILTLITE